MPFFSSMYSISASSLGKRFGDRKVFSEISLSLRTGQSLAITGRNGSGKSTLLSILLGIVRPTRGEVRFRCDGDLLDDALIRATASLVSPYLNLYDQLSGEENLSFFATLSGVNLTGKEVDALLVQVGLEGRGVDLVGTYSSGMKQRLKYAAALLKDPAYLFLDEPTANLDTDGKQIVQKIIDDRRASSVILIATNEEAEYSLADEVLRLDN
jgi:heme exporter protein A